MQTPVAQDPGMYSGEHPSTEQVNPSNPLPIQGSAAHSESVTEPNPLEPLLSPGGWEADSDLVVVREIKVKIKINERNRRVKMEI